MYGLKECISPHRVAKEKSDTSLAQYIGEQKVILNDILLILKNYQRDAQFSNLIKDLELIKLEFDKVKISYQMGEPMAVEQDGMLMIVSREVALLKYHRKYLAGLLILLSVSGISN